jgi:CcmD family protein
MFPSGKWACVWTVALVRRGANMHSLVSLMLVPLLVWIAVWAYLWNLDAKVRRLQEEMRRLDEPESEEE